jgi:hypothetical protein
LAERFSQIDDKIVREELKEAEKNQERIRFSSYWPKQT